MKLCSPPCLAVLVSLCGALCACSPSADAPKAQAPASSPFRVVLSLNQLMTRVIDPAADGIWDSVQTIVTQKGSREIQPQTDEEWQALVSHAATLTEAANLLMIDGRAVDQQQWLQHAHRLSTTAEHAMQAALNKNPTQVFEAGGEIYEVCRGCHQRYAPQLNSSPGEPSADSATQSKPQS